MDIRKTQEYLNLKVYKIEIGNLLMKIPMTNQILCGLCVMCYLKDSKPIIVVSIIW